MTVIPCQKNPNVDQRLEELADVLMTRVHEIPGIGFDEHDLYQAGLFRGAVEKIRGRYAATMGPKREFVRRVLSFMQDGGFIADWSSAGEQNRHDYTVTLNDGRTSVIELKGCLDGNNTTIFSRPPHAAEFVIWSVCPSTTNDPRHSVWSGIHTRLSAEIISRNQRVDGLVVWDWMCGTIGRPCPKILNGDPMTEVAQFELTPPCIYLFPPTVPSTRNNSNPAPNQIQQVGILDAMHQCFRGSDAYLNSVNFEVRNNGPELERRTTISREGVVVRQSKFTPIRRE